MKQQTKKSDENSASTSAKKTVKMFARTLPNILAVVFLSGLFIEFVPIKRLSDFFGGGLLTDGLIGAIIGSVSTGNPLISYALGGELLDHGMSLVAVTALIVSWVTVGSIQFPAEIQAFGFRFAIIRNCLSFLFAIAIAFLTIITMRFMGIG